MDQDLSLTRASRPGSGAATGIGLVLVLLLSLVVPVVQARAADPGLYDQVRSDYEAITYDDLASILDIRIRSLDKNAARTALKERLGREATEQEVEQSLWPRYMDQLAMRKDFEALKADLGTRMRELISKDRLGTTVNALNHKIFRGYLLDTDDFRSSIYREPTARELWVRNGSESDGSGAGTYEQPYQNIATAMRNARPGDVVKLKEDVTVNGTAASVLLDKAVTLDGTGHTLVLRGQDIEVAADVTIRDMNLVMLQESSASGTIYAGGHKLVLDKVTTRVSQSQTGQRPVIVTGTKGDRAPGPKAEVVVRNATDQTRFKSIIVGDLDTASSTPASIVLDSRLIRVEDGVFLSPPNGPVRNGAVDLVSKSDFVNIVRNPAVSTKTGDSSVTFDGASLSGVVMDEVNNLTLANKARVTLADGSKDLLISGVLNLQDQTVLDVAETFTSVGESTGSGLVRIGDQGAFLSGATSETISYEVYKGDWDYSEYLGKAYVGTNDPALEPVVRLLPAGSPYRLVKDDRGTWRLQAVDTTAKVAPVAAVTLSEDGRPKALTAGEFAVTVTPHPDNDTAVEVTGLPTGEVAVGDDGSADLGRWSIGTEGVYRFTVRQVDKGAAGVTYDQEPVEVTVTVEQNPEFPTRLGLVATTTFRKAGAVVQGISFANTFTAPAQDADGDGVVDSVDACEGTPVGAQVGVDGCSVAPSLGVVPGVVGVKGKALAAVSVPVSNPGAAKGLRCVAQGLPAGLVVALAPSGDACVISGTPEVDTSKDQAFTVSLFYTPVDGARPEASVSGPGVVSVRLPAFKIGGSILQDDDGDGVADVSDRCEGTPSGVRVGADGCALAPVLGAVPELTGVKGKALTAVSVPVGNGGSATGLRCVAQGLPAGLVVALAPSGDACVISGTPEVDTSKDQAFTVSLFYTPVDGKRPEASISAQGKANITLPALSLGPSTKQDDDADGVLDEADKCAGTPAGAQVGVDGCSVAPSLGVVPELTGVKGKALTAVSVPVSNPGAAKGLRCVAQGLPAGLVVALAPSGDACVISGTPEVDTSKDQAFTVSLFYTPVDGKRPEASISAQGKANITLPALSLGPSTKQDDDADGVLDEADKCADTPSGVRVGVDGCSVAPSLGVVPELTGVKGKALTAVSVPVSNPGAAKGLRCVAQGLPAGLVVALAPSGDACVISGTPEVDTSKDQAFTVSLFYTPVDGARPEASVSGPGVVSVRLPAFKIGGSILQDDDGDGVADVSDRCEGTPSGVRVGADGCALAPVLGAVPELTGVKGEALAAVRVPLGNGGSATGLRCVAQGLPAGLVVALSTSGDACVISGTPEVDTRKDQAFTVSLFYTPVDGKRPEASISAQGKANITLPALSLRPGQKASPSPTPTAQSQATASASAEPTATSTATPLPQQQVKEQGKGLARTGMDAFQLLILLAGLLVSGGVLVAYRRQRG